MEMDLQINVRKNGTTRIIELNGEVDAYTSARFREIMLELIDDGGIDLIINMCKVEYIDSSGLGALVGGLKRVSERDGKIMIVSDGPQIKKVFEITGLEKVFPIFDAEHAAVTALDQITNRNRGLVVDGEN
ncbi:MAG: STAS domain-containing protein [Armatimonadota bacterium]